MNLDIRLARSSQVGHMAIPLSEVWVMTRSGYIQEISSLLCRIENCIWSMKIDDCLEKYQDSSQFSFSKLGPRCYLRASPPHHYIQVTLVSMIGVDGCRNMTLRYSVPQLSGKVYALFLD